MQPNIWQSDQGYDLDLNLGIDIIDADLSRYHEVAIPGFTNGAVEPATTTFYANNSFNLGTSGPNHHGHIDAGYIGHTLSNVSAPVSVFDQGNYATLPPQYDNGGYPHRYVDRNFYPSNNTNATTFEMAHGYNGSAIDGTNLGAPSTGTTTTVRGTLSAPTPGFIGDQYSQYGDDAFPAGNTSRHTSRHLHPSSNANATALGLGHDRGGYATAGAAFGVPSTGMTTNRSSTLSAPTPGPVGSQYPRYGDGVNLASHASRDFYSLNNTSTRAFEMTHGGSSYVNDGNAFRAPSTSAVNTMGGTMLGSPFGRPVGNRHLQQSDGYYPIGYSTANPNLSINTLRTDTGTAPGSNSHATNDTAIGTAHGSSSNAANDTVLAGQLPSTPPTLRSNFSPSAPGPATGPDGRARWPCTTCGKTFSRQSDVTRHAKKHSDKLPFQCRFPGCEYKGSYRRDKLAQHKLN